MDFIFPLLIIFGIIGVGSYGFYKHAVKHTDGTDDIQTADTEQKGLMSSAHATKLATVETNAKDDQTGAEIKALLEALTGVDRLVAVAIQHLDNLGVTPSADQWGYLGELTHAPSYITIQTDTVSLLSLGNQNSKDWTDLDINTAGSGIVPTTAVGVFLEVGASDTGGSATTIGLAVRKKGETGAQQHQALLTQANNRWIYKSMIIALDVNGLIEYSLYASGANTLSITINLAGWIEPA